MLVELWRETLPWLYDDINGKVYDNTNKKSFGR